MFAVREKVVYPGHGVAEIVRIFENKVGTTSMTFYELKFLNKDATVFVPTANAEAIGIRQLCSPENVRSVFDILTQPAIRVRPHNEYNASNWNKKSKDYYAVIRTGNIERISAIYRDLRTTETIKELSFGEKNLLQEIEKLLAEEISLVQKSQHDKTIEQLRTLSACTREKGAFVRHA